MEKKSFLAGIAASALVVGGGIAGMAAVNAQQAPAGEQGEAVVSESVNVPSGDYAPEVVEAEAVPSPEPAETVEQPEAAPVASKPAPTKPQPVQQEGVTIVEPAPAPKTWTGEDGRTYAPNPLDSSPAAPPVIVEPEPTGPGDFVAPPPPPTPGG